MKKCRICGAPHHAKGLCKRHYQLQHSPNRTMDICLDCTEVKPLVGRRLCRNCYMKHYRSGTLETFPKVFGY